jgi:nucleoside-diphosphate-sugar epimerase
VKCLVTGGSGYFGSLLVERLVADGHAVRNLDLLPAEHPDGVDFVSGDVRDRALVDDAVAACDVVFHNVAQVPLAQDLDLLRTVNVDGTRVLLDACESAGVAKIVHTSSSAVFGIPTSNPVLPTTVPRPAEAYGHAKLAAEWACLDAVRRGLDVSIVRPRTILGHGRLGIFGILFDWIADGADPVVLGDGTNRYQFVHADDLADAIVRAASISGPGVFNIGTDRFGTMAEALAHVCAHAGTGSTVRRVAAGPTAALMRLSSKVGLTPFAPYHWLMYARSMWFDIEHARTALDWSPRWSTDDMFVQSYDWFVGHRAATSATDVSHHRRTTPQGALRWAKHVTRVFPAAEAVVR